VFAPASRLLCSPPCSASVGDTHQAVSVLGQTKNEGVLGVQYYLLVRTVSKFEWGWRCRWSGSQFNSTWWDDEGIFLAFGQRTRTLPR
jgi:hypothetical protein